MRINSIKYQDKDEEWGYDEISFSDLTLLVGLSGAGKTQILNSITNLQAIASGESFSGLVWEISFSVESQDYLWKGESELVSNPKHGRFSNFFPSHKHKILFESLYLNNELVAERKENNKITFDGHPLPRLAHDKSLLSMFKEESKIKPAFEGFRKITLRDHTIKEVSKGGILSYSEFEKVYKTLNEIQNTSLNIFTKLYFLQKNLPNIFSEIKATIIDAFDKIEDIKIRLETYSDTDDEFIFEEILLIKEKGVKKWIPDHRISSGMLRTIIHISEMYLLPKGTVILIDEFENSLGVNCINVLTEDLLFENNRIQFIATSHHPYIINKIPYEYWKIVTRKNGQIKTYDATEFNLGDSNHERFMNLINLPKYREGITS